MLATIKEIISTSVRHYKEGNLNWPMIIYIGLAHIGEFFPTILEYNIFLNSLYLYSSGYHWHLHHP